MNGDNYPVYWVYVACFISALSISGALYWSFDNLIKPRFESVKEVAGYLTLVLFLITLFLLVVPLAYEMRNCQQYQSVEDALYYGRPEMTDIGRAINVILAFCVMVVPVSLSILLVCMPVGLLPYAMFSLFFIFLNKKDKSLKKE